MQKVTLTTPSHRIEHDPWMLDPMDVDYLLPHQRWCRVCGEKDRYHSCAVCCRPLEDPWTLWVDGKITECCAHSQHRPFYSPAQFGFITMHQQDSAAMLEP